MLEYVGRSEDLRSLESFAGYNCFMNPYEPPISPIEKPVLPTTPSRIEANSHDFLFACYLMIVATLSMIIVALLLSVVFDR